MKNKDGFHGPARPDKSNEGWYGTVRYVMNDEFWG